MVKGVLRERKPYLGACARNSFEQGALCALVAVTSDQASYAALPGDAFVTATDSPSNRDAAYFV